MEEHLLPSVSYNAVQSHTPPRNHRLLTRRSRSAPSLFTCTQSIPPCLAIDDSHRTPSIVRIASIGAGLYITLGVIVYIVKRDSFSGHRTCSLVDALYFSVVTLCTIGYGDIVPRTPLAKLFVCAFVLVGFGFIDVLLDGLVRHVLDRQEAVLLSAVDGGERSNVVLRTYVMDVEKRRMRIRIKVGCALCVVVGCVASGTVAARVLEGLDWLESFYLSVTSVTTVGYGDYSFMTVRGRAFATAWLLVSTLAVARAFLYLTELRIERRNRRIAEWVMKKKMTVGDLVAADLDSDGSIRTNGESSLTFCDDGWKMNYIFTREETLSVKLKGIRWTWGPDRVRTCLD
ncbi:Two-pore potassium channel 2 [Acorus calamus]|uniref:Two-pore potassium channel 2 n=1 Tax=Acorus calamus TaxID=4465 RepID=A0AAV9DNR2_ACOCL|nr:Two-pore potassium channel 2 [Acorus calamus]